MDLDDITDTDKAILNTFDGDDSATTGNANIDKAIQISLDAQDGTNHAEESQTEETQNQNAQTNQQPNKEQADKSAGTSNQANDGKQPNGQDQNAVDPNVKGKPDAAGNIVAQDGRIIAKAGSERRLWERAENSTRALEHSQRHIQTLEKDVGDWKREAVSRQYLNGLPQQLGIDHEDVNMGLKIIANFRKDPANTVKYILTEYAAMGHNVNDLLGKEGTLDMSAVKRMIDGAISPLAQERQVQTREQQANVAAEQQYNAFVSKYPAALTHDNDLAKLMDRDPNLTAETAFFMLKSWASEHGYDFNQPLGPQHAAKTQGANQGQQPSSSTSNQPNSNQQNQPPFMGRSVQQDNVVVNKTTPSMDDDFEDIIRQEMKQAGYAM